MKRTSLWFSNALLPQGWAAGVRIVLEGGRISTVEAGVSANEQDARHGVALPGMPNVHSHAFQRAIAGLTYRRGATADSFWTWREAMYRFVELLSPDDLETIAAQAYVEMLEAGFTRVGEFHYLHHAPDGSRYTNLAENCSRIASAAAETGIALTLLPVFYAHSGFGGAPPRATQRRFVCTEDEYARLFEQCRSLVSSSAGAVVGVAPHSLRAVTPKELETLVALAPAAPLHIHVAEQEQEVRDCVAWCGQWPVEWLLNTFDVNERWCLVHATHVNDDELQALVKSRAIVGLCPITEADLGDGIFPAERFILGASAFGIGSDSNVLIDVAQELRCLEYGQRLSNRSRNVFAMKSERSTGRMLFELAWGGGTASLGGEPLGLAAGAPADIVTLNLDGPTFVGRSGDEVLDSWIFAARERVVDCVWRDGVCVVKDGRHVRRESIERRYVEVMKRLLI